MRARDRHHAPAFVPAHPLVKFAAACGEIAAGFGALGRAALDMRDTISSFATLSKINRALADVTMREIKKHADRAVASSRKRPSRRKDRAR